MYGHFRPAQGVAVGVEFRQDLAEQQYQECQDYGLQDETPYSAQLAEYGTQCESTQHDYGHIDQIVGNEYRGEEAFRFACETAYRFACRRFVEVVDLLRGKGEVGYFASRYETREHEGYRGQHQGYDLGGVERCYIQQLFCRKSCIEQHVSGRQGVGVER